MVLDYQLITNNQGLQHCIEQARQSSVVALDTEFVRVRTYYPQLGLIQLYDGKKISLIDPTHIDNFTPLQQLLADQNVLKVLHSASEDLEIFAHYFQQLPDPMLDTQIMANFLGFPPSISFAKLVEHYLQISLDKGASRTDWLARPLSQQQLNYAAADVYYLFPVFQQMQPLFLASKWKSVIEQECIDLGIKRSRQIDPELAYLEIGNAWRLNRQELNVLKFLAKWRLQESIKRDIAQAFVLKTDALWQIAKSQPKHTNELVELGLHPNEIRRHGKKLLQLVEQANKQPVDSYPQLIANVSDHADYKRALRHLQRRLKQICPEDIPAQLIASKKTLHQLLKWYWLETDKKTHLPKLLKNWRKPYGDALVAELDSLASI